MGPHPSNQDAPSAPPPSLQHKWWIVSFCLLGLAWGAWGWPSTLPLADAPGDYLSSTQSQEVRDFQSVTRDFGFTRSVLVGMGAPVKEDVFSGRMLTLNRHLTRVLGKLAGIESVLSITSSQAISKEQGALVVRPMLAPQTKLITTTIQHRLRKQVMGDPLLRGSLVSPDGAYTLLLVQLAPQNVHRTAISIRKHVERLAHKYPFARISLTGQPITGPIIQAAATKDAKAFGPVMLALFLLFLSIAIGRWRGAISALLLAAFVVCLGATASLGLFGAVYAHLAWLPLLAWWIAATWAIHPRYSLSSPPSPRGAKTPIALTYSQQRIAAIAITGAASLALLLAPAALLQRMGSAGWIAGLSTIALLWLLFPQQPLAIAARSQPIRPSGIPRILWWVVLAGLALGCLWLPLGGLPDAVFPHKSRLALGEQLQRQHFGGASPLLIRFRGDLRDPSTLKAVERLSRRLEAHPAVFAPQSIAGLIRQLNALLNQWPRIPDQSKQINALWMFLEGQPALKSLVRQQGKDAILQARVKLPRGWQARRLRQDLQRMVADLPTRGHTRLFKSLSTPQQAQTIQRRVTWIEEGLHLWVQRHTEQTIPQTLHAPLRQVIQRFATAANQAPPQQPLPRLRLYRKLRAYITSKDCDLELAKPLQERLLQALLMRNHKGQLRQPGVLSQTLQQTLKNSPAASDQESIKYALRALHHTLQRLQQQQHLERFQQALFQTWRRDPRFLDAFSIALRKQNHTSPQQRMAELQGELREIFSTTAWIQDAAQPPSVTLQTTITGLPPLLLGLQQDAQQSLLYGIALLVIAASLLLTLFLRHQLSPWRCVASLLLTWLLTLGAMGYLQVPLHLLTCLVLLLIGLLTLLITIPISLTHQSQQSFQHTIHTCLWLSMPLTPLLFASLPLLQQIATLLFLAPWLASAAAIFVHTKTRS